MYFGSGFLSHKNLFSFEDHKTKYNKPSKRKSFLEALNEIENNPDIKDLNELSDEDGSSGNEDYQQEEQVLHVVSMRFIATAMCLCYTKVSCYSCYCTLIVATLKREGSVWCGTSCEYKKALLFCVRLLD